MSVKSLWRPGKRRGEFEAVRNIVGDDGKKRRERHTLKTQDPAEADRLIARLNEEVVTGGKTTVAACIELHKHAMGERWTRHHERSRKRMIPAFGHIEAEKLSEDEVELYIESRQRDGVAQDTIRLELAYMRAALRFAARKKRITAAPYIPVPAPGQPRERWLTREDARKLIDSAQELHVKLYIVLAIVTAARPSHLLQLTWDAIDLEHRIIDLDASGKSSRNKRRPKVPMNDTAYQHLTMARPLARTGTIIEFRGKPITSVRRGITEAARRAELKDVTPYVLRHTAGVWMAKEGVPIEEIAAFMGHSNIEITRRHYAQFHPSFMSKSARALEL